MTNLEKILSLAREQIGTAENPPGSNKVIYNTDYYGGPVQGSGFPWCCSFIWWLFWKSGLSALFCGGQKTAYCPFVVDYARQHGQWVDGDYRPGDLLLYDWDGDGVADHIGLCESGVDGMGNLSAIEGNVGDAVQRISRWTGSILGACRPEWGEDTSSASDGAPSPQGEGMPETYTVQPGDSLWAIAQRAGTTVDALARINAISDPARIWPGQVLRVRETGDTSSAPAGAPSPPGEGEKESDAGAASPTDTAGTALQSGDITALARAVIRGEYGNGLERRLRLGKKYAEVQAEVNRLLSGRKA